MTDGRNPLHPGRAALEAASGAHVTGNSMRATSPTEASIALSHAISAKRQADALERIAEALAKLACCEYEDGGGDHYFRVLTDT